MTSTSPRRIRLRLFPPAGGAGGYEFTLAGHSILSDSPFDTVLPRDRVTAIPGLSLDPAPLPPEPAEPAEPFSSFRGFVAGRRRRIRCRDDEGHLIVEIPSIGTFSVDGNGFLRHLPPGGGAADGGLGGSPAELQQAALGPLLILVLALRGLFCLHCSAVAADDGACLFLGESGAGKSTLGRALGRAGWERLADDLLPLELVDGTLVAWTDFPQLKEPLGPRRRRVPVAGFYVLAEGPQVGMGDLGSAEAALALAANTAAARLFPKQLLARHLTAMAAWSRRAPIRRLTYPRRFEALPEVARALAESAGGRPAPGEGRRSPD